MTETLIAATTMLAVTALLSFSVLSAWRGWLDLRRLELAQRSVAADAGEQDVGLRIELAGVKERLKKLEAIASGIEP